jgi:hypothetical protein
MRPIYRPQYRPPYDDRKMSNGSSVSGDGRAYYDPYYQQGYYEPQGYYPPNSYYGQGYPQQEYYPQDYSYGSQAGSQQYYKAEYYYPDAEHVSGPGEDANSTSLYPVPPPVMPVGDVSPQSLNDAIAPQLKKELNDVEILSQKVAAVTLKQSEVGNTSDFRDSLALVDDSDAVTLALLSPHQDNQPNEDHIRPPRRVSYVNQPKFSSLQLHHDATHPMPPGRRQSNLSAQTDPGPQGRRQSPVLLRHNMPRHYSPPLRPQTSPVTQTHELKHQPSYASLSNPAGSSGSAEESPEPVLKGHDGSRDSLLEMYTTPLAPYVPIQQQFRPTPRPQMQKQFVPQFSRPNFHQPRPFLSHQPHQYDPNPNARDDTDNISLSSNTTTNTAATTAVREALLHHEDLESYRKTVKKSSDPKIQLDFAKQLITVAEGTVI